VHSREGGMKKDRVGVYVLMIILFVIGLIDNDGDDG
jgi:hypothetical protein